MSESNAEFVYRNYSETVLKSRTFIYTWKIRNFQLYISDVENKCLTSKSKVLGENEKTLWSVQLFINNSKLEYEYNQSVTKYYLHAVVTFDTDAAELNRNYANIFFVYIIKDNGTEEEVYYGRNVLVDSKTNITISNFKLRNAILDKKNQLLSNGDLTLRFKVCGATGDVVNQSEPIFFDSISNKQPQFIGFENVLNNKKFSDVKITIRNKELYAYKGILADRSPVFAAMFQHNMKENVDSVVKVKDVDYKIMQEMLRFIYSGKVNNIEDIASDLLIAADKYGIEDLKLMCEKILINNLKVDTVTNLLILAVKHSAMILKNSALDFFKLHAKEIVKTEKYEKDIKDLFPIFSDIIKSLAL